MKTSPKWTQRIDVSTSYSYLWKVCYMQHWIWWREEPDEFIEHLRSGCWRRECHKSKLTSSSNTQLKTHGNDGHHDIGILFICHLNDNGFTTDGTINFCFSPMYPALGGNLLHHSWITWYHFDLWTLGSITPNCSQHDIFVWCMYFYLDAYWLLIWPIHALKCIVYCRLLDCV